MSDRDALAFLQVWRRLEVGPPRVEPRRIVVPYRIETGGDAEQTELIVKWPEDVFEPGDPTSDNLAALIGAQVALNYALFADEIVFHGPFDRADRQFLRDAASNTAREIYVHKILAPNPFLRAPASEAPLVRLDDYALARLRFPDPVPTLPGDPWAAPGRRIAVLASGGKESLASQGLLEEAGYEVHALFGNESGRHWFTALNGYRYLAQTRPETTARVWTNSDRLFAWFLRHLPFVRPDFAQQRADEYPIRLWTVAVFLFGALPLMRKRGLGRIVIGDEFDTTRHPRHRGVPHYDGLYDQSRWFDESLSRYYHRKGWQVVQCSILRTCSELLVEKTLVERYPHLLEQQVSCHAASVQGERVVPCGRCEKCRRVVGMLVALGADPGVCGYGPTSVDESLRALAEHGAHQEPEAVRHNLHLLVEGGLISADAPAAADAGPVPEVMKLRFHAVQSPPHHLPRDLRAPVYRLLLEVADGAVVRKGRAWLPFDPLSDPAMARPHPQDPHPAARVDDSLPADLDGTVLGELTWPQARRRLGEVDVALLPVGAIEQHGPHLPLDTDAWDADRLARDVASACADPKPLVLPAIPYGVSYHHEDFAGTLSISPETLARLVHEIGLDAARWGIRKLVIINGHGGNIPALQYAAQNINRDAHIFTCVDTGESSDADFDALIETPGDVHAGEYETSTSLYLRPERVYLDRAVTEIPRFDNRYLDFGSNVGVAWFARTAKLSPSGVMGDPSKATAAKGEQMWTKMVANLVELVEFLQSASLDRIYKRRE